MRKVIYPIMVLLLATVLGACGNTKKESTVKQEKIYATKVTKISNNEYGDWVVEGTTSAPNNAKIMVTSSDTEEINFGEDATDSASDGWTTVHQGKFKVIISGINVHYEETYSVGTTAKAYIFAIDNYNKKWDYINKIPKRVLTTMQNKITPTKLTYNQEIVDYLNDIKSSSSESDDTLVDESSATSESSDNTATTYDATEGENNAQTHTYGEFVKSDDWLGKSYHISKAKVLQADEDEDGTTLLVYTDDDPSHLFMVLYEDKTDAVEDDYVDIEGVFLKRQTYDTQIGGSNTVPALVTQKMTVTGSDTEEY